MSFWTDHRIPGASGALWAAIEKRLAIGLLTAHALTTIHYLIQRERGAREARAAVAAILGVFGVAAVDESVLRIALGLPWPDFEDAVCAAAAQASACDAIVTRDPRGFRGSPVPVMDPQAALAWLAAG